MFHRPRAQVGDVVGDAAVDREQQTKRQLGYGDRVLARAIRDANAARCRGLDVDRVHAGAGADDELERGAIIVSATFVLSGR